MKATKIISACAVLVALASCSNDHVISQPGAEDTPIRIQANVGAVTTKAGAGLYDQNNNFENGAKINVYIFENSGTTYTYGTSGLLEYTADGNGNLDVKDPGGSSVPQYFPANGHGIDVWGVYPSTVTESSISKDFSIENDQTSDADYKASDLMFATEKTNQKKGAPISLIFAHKLSKIIVKLDKEPGVNADLTDAVIKLTNVSTKVPLTKVDHTGILLGTASTNQQDIKELTIGKYEAINGTAAIVIPQPTSTMKFKVELASGGTYTASIPSDPGNFAPNTAYTYTLKLKANGITVTASIEDWTPGTGGNGDAILN